MHPQLNVMKCPFKSNQKPPACNFRVSVCSRILFRLGLGLLFVSLQGLSLGGHFMSFILRTKQ